MFFITIGEHGAVVSLGCNGAKWLQIIPTTGCLVQPMIEKLMNCHELLIVIVDADHVFADALIQVTPAVVDS